MLGYLHLTQGCQFLSYLPLIPKCFQQFLPLLGGRYTSIKYESKVPGFINVPKRREMLRPLHNLLILILFDFLRNASFFLFLF